MLQKSLESLNSEQTMKFVKNSLQGSQLLALLANIIHLFYLENEKNATELAFPVFTVIFFAFNPIRNSNSTSTLQFVVTKILHCIPLTVGKSGTAFTQWHELLGWFSPGPDLQHHENLPLIKKQVHLLWSHRNIKILFGDNLKKLTVGYEHVEVPVPASTTTNLLKRALERSSVKGSPSGKSNKPYRKLGSDEVSRVALVCTIYHAALTTLAQLRLDILSGEWCKDLSSLS
jgi:ubiquitin-protein ligase E3 B